MDYDAIVVGTGITGSFTALALHERGLRVAVVDRGGLAPGTSRGSDGNLLCSDKSPGLMLDLARRSLELWHRFVERYGNDCEFDPKGATVVARGEEQSEALRTYVENHTRVGMDCRFLDADWLALEPHLGPDTTAVGYWPDDAQVQPMLACYQIARILQGGGVPYYFYQAVDDIRTDTAGVAVTLADGRSLDARHLCVCAGAWTNEVLAPLDRSVPVRPRKGHILVLERGDVAIHSKIADFGYNATAESTDEDDESVQTATIIEATRSGTILCGSSREFAGFDTTIDEGTVRRIMADCIGVVPDLARLRLIRAYTGLRPFSPDGHPIIGPLPGDERVLVATGQEGAGHGLAPISGELVADCIVNGNTHPLGGQLHPGRWAVS
ncbi:MAG: FAD-dependent oxidoreductase [Halofilum sp. (in: g-proteobacteria)]|nr:FAD-dependent oxidoreductase [Halofilum sp. (in: g-proteobacteria)]